MKNIKKLTETELKLNISGKASWHNQYKDSAWVFIGGLPYDLSEGDVITIFSQYDINKYTSFSSYHSFDISIGMEKLSTSTLFVIKLRENLKDFAFFVMKIKGQLSWLLIILTV